MLFIMGYHGSLLFSCVFLIGLSPHFCSPRNRARSRSPPALHPSVVLNNPYIVIAGEKLKLPCKVTGNPKPFKVWYKNSRQISSEYSKKFTIARNSLIIDPVEMTDTAIYHCHASNSLGEKWFNFTVKVIDEDYYIYEDDYLQEYSCEDKPKFTKGKTPGNWIAKTERSSLRINCAACGNPKPTIKFYKDGHYLDPDLRGATYKVEKFTLKIDSVQTDQGGNYTCAVENELGRINFTYRVEVLVSRGSVPVIVGPVNQTVEVGSNARFECKVPDSGLQDNIQWLQHYTVNGSYRDENDQPYTNIIQQSVVNFTQPELLIIRNVTMKDAGLYTCLVSNPLGRDYQSAWLTVKDMLDEDDNLQDNKCDEKPKFSKGNTPGYWIAKQERSSLRINCAACGNPKPTIKFYKDDHYILPDVREEKYKVEEFTLSIESLEVNQGGKYTCVVENKHGKINSTYKVEVLVSRPIPPVIGTAPSNQTVQVGTDAMFECKVLIKDSQHYIHWFQHYTVNGSYWDKNGHPYVNSIEQTVENKTQPELLIIKNVTMKNEGWYTCVVFTPMRREQRSAWLTVINATTIVSSTKDGQNEQFTIYIIVGVCGFIMFVVMILICVFCRKNPRARLEKYRSVRKVIVTRPETE